MSDNSSNMTDSEKSKCHAIIHSAATATAAVETIAADLLHRLCWDGFRESGT
ncbi:MAG: hypothetical protein IJP54_00600 [Synergistaceae bacterium]|nr:hypothetical protein [Synergistaceae bacterium]